MNEFSCKQIEQCLTENLIDLNKLQSKCDKIKHRILKNRKCEDVSEIVLQFINDIKQKYVGEKASKYKLVTSIECYILNQFHDAVAPIFYEAFKTEDELIFQKCLSLQNVKFSHNFDHVQLPASIVELASLDAHKTVHEKMACMSACYDFIFADLKFAMVELIAESGGDCSEIPGNIPIANNQDIVLLLVEVILRAKCKHLYSNLYFVQSLGDLHLTDKDCERVLLCFNEAIEVLTDINEDSAGTFRKTCSEMDRFVSLTTVRVRCQH